MTLPSSGQISLNQVNVELGYAATSQIAMAGGPVRTLFGVPSGEIGMDDGYGKSNWAPSGTLVAQGVNGGSISAQAGDLVIASAGTLVTTTSVAISGFTTIYNYLSTYQWYHTSPTFYVRARQQYKILTGSETTIGTSMSSGAAAWQQWRFNNPINSVSVTYIDVPAAGYGNVSANHPARTSQPESVMRVVSFAGYGATFNPYTYTLSPPDSGFTVADTGSLGGTYARQLSVPTFGAVSLEASITNPNTFRGLGIATTLTLTQ